MNNINDVKDKFMLSVSMVAEEDAEESSLECRGTAKIKPVNTLKNLNGITEIPLLFYTISGNPAEIIHKIIMNALSPLAHVYAVNNNLDSVEVMKDWMKQYESR